MTADPTGSAPFTPEDPETVLVPDLPVVNDPFFRDFVGVDRQAAQSGRAIGETAGRSRLVKGEISPITAEAVTFKRQPTFRTCRAKTFRYATDFVIRNVAEISARW